MELPEGIEIGTILPRQPDRNTFLLGPCCTTHGPMKFRDTGHKLTDHWICPGWDGNDCGRMLLVDELEQYWATHPYWHNSATMPEPVRSQYLQWKAGNPDSVIYGPYRGEDAHVND